MEFPRMDHNFSYQKRRFISLFLYYYFYQAYLVLMKLKEINHMIIMCINYSKKLLVNLLKFKKLSLANSEIINKLQELQLNSMFYIKVYFIKLYFHKNTIPKFT